jgi:hypothetical protein
LTEGTTENETRNPQSLLGCGPLRTRRVGSVREHTETASRTQQRRKDMQCKPSPFRPDSLQTPLQHLYFNPVTIVGCLRIACPFDLALHVLQPRNSHRNRPIPAVLIEIHKAPLCHFAKLTEQRLPRLVVAPLKKPLALPAGNGRVLPC